MKKKDQYILGVAGSNFLVTEIGVARVDDPRVNGVSHVGPGIMPNTEVRYEGKGPASLVLLASGASLIISDQFFQSPSGQPVWGVGSRVFRSIGPNYPTGMPDPQDKTIKRFLDNLKYAPHGGSSYLLNLTSMAKCKCPADAAGIITALNEMGFDTKLYLDASGRVVMDCWKASKPGIVDDSIVSIDPVGEVKLYTVHSTAGDYPLINGVHPLTYYPVEN